MTTDTRKKLFFADFYVTNVCNYSCRNCNRFNEFKFTGHHLWSAHADDYEKLSKKVSFERIGLSGGESFLNPDLPNWVAGVRKLWPEADLWVGTNGSRLKFVNNLYEMMIENNLGINLIAHRNLPASEIKEQVYAVLKEPISVQYKHDFSTWVDVYNTIREEGWPDCNSIDEYDQLPEYIKEKCVATNSDPFFVLSTRDSTYWVDRNGARIFYNPGYHFVTAGLKFTEPDQFEVFNSDPEKSHEVCFSKHCHLFHNGKLHKCSQVAVLPDFMKQFKVNISDEDMALLLAYKPLESDATPQEVLDWVTTNKKAIPQCKLCPTNLERIEIDGSQKKRKIIKINNKLSSD